MKSYTDFLRTKLARPTPPGIKASPSDVNCLLYPFQRQLVMWACRKARAAIFADCGLGKTLMQLEWARLMGERTLVVAPLAVAQQTLAEAGKLGVQLGYRRSQATVDCPITVTNYELVDRFDPAAFGAVVLDESSILKSVDGKTRTKLIALFRDTPYRLCCTATPAPNDIAEIANHAEFLGVMSRAEMLAAYFVHDDNGWRLKGHAREPFLQWLASWAMMLKRPSDIGFADDGYRLPKLEVAPVWVSGNGLAVAQAAGQLFATELKGIQGRTAARRLSVAAKVQVAAEIVNGSKEQWIVWCGLNDEGRKLRKAVTDAVLVEGQDSLDFKTERIISFIRGDIRVLITKTRIGGFGLNLQNCHNMMFLGLSDSYESYYQAIRRCWRFGQCHPVNVAIVLSDLEKPVLENVLRKQELDKEISERIVRSIVGYEMQELTVEQVSRNGYHEGTVETEGYIMMLGDCVERMRELPDASVDLSLFSPPFLSLYTYSDSERDMGNSRDEEEFFQHFGYMLTELHRVVKTGRIVVVHVAQVAAKLAHDGFIGLKDFRGKVIDAFIGHDFVYHGDITIDKNPQAQAIRTHSKGLLFKQLRKDASWLRPGLADYLLVFRKPGESVVPIHPDITNNDWVTWAHPVWYDVKESETLNARLARSERDERHIAPLQLSVIERCIRLWSNPGESVLSPFAGIGSEGYVAIQQERRFLGIELKPEYYQVALRNLEDAVLMSKKGNLL